MVERLTQHFNSGDIDATTLRELFPDKKLQDELESMKKMMMSVVQNMKVLSERINVCNTQTAADTAVPLNTANSNDVEQSASSEVQADDPGDNPDDDDDDDDVVLDEQVSNVSLCDTNASTRYQRNVNQPRLTVKDIAETIPEFDPSNELSLSAEQFVQHVDGAKSTYDWHEKSLLLAIYSRLKGVGRMWFDSRSALFTTWDELKEELLNEFGSNYDEAEVNYKMTNTVRRSDEKIIDYCFRVHTLGKRYNLSESAVIRYARNGLKHNALQTALAAKKFTTMRELRETIHDYFANMPTTSKTKEYELIKTRNFHGKTEQKPFNTTPYRDTRGFTCFNCNERGHLAKNCPKPQKKPRCQYCQRTTHKAEECPDRQPNITRKLNVNAIVDTDDTYNDVLKNVSVNGKTTIAFLDSGSSATLVRKTFAERITNKFIDCWKKLHGFAGGSYVITQKMEAVVRLDDHEYNTELFLVHDEEIPEDVLVGRNLLCRNGNRMVIEDGKCRIEHVNTINATGIASSTQNEIINAILDRNRSCIAEEISDLGKCSVEQMKIELTTNEPINMKPYRTAFAKREIITKIINDLLVNDIIRPSRSTYASPVVLVEKKNGEHRLCMDYRKLNKITKRIPYPMPNLEEQFAQLAGNKYFSTLDLRMGYHQIEMKEDSKKYTAFVTTGGHYEFNRMPFGLVNAPAVFQRVMNAIVGEMKAGEILCYLDDIIIPSKSIEEGAERLERFLKILTLRGLTIRLEKCKFLVTELEHLGHVINAEGIGPGTKKVEAIRHFKAPTNITEVRRFLGLTGFFRKFVQDYAMIAKSITKMLSKSEANNFNWGNEQQQAFEKLKAILTNAPLLALYDMTKKHEVHTDACAIGLAGVLLQATDAENWQPVMFFSRHCTAAEQKYHSYELEVLAVVETLERFRVYVLGKKFRVITDCAAIVKTNEQHELKPRIARWWLRLQEYDFDLVHRAGTRLAHVDAMSRSPVGYQKPCEPAGYTYTLTDQQSDWVVAMQRRDDRIKYITAVLTGKIKPPDEAQIKRDYSLTEGRVHYNTPQGPRFYVLKTVRCQRWAFYVYLELSTSQCRQLGRQCRQ